MSRSFLRPGPGADGDRRVVLPRTVRTVVAIGSWLALAWLVLIYLTRSDLRSGLGCCGAIGYLLLAWFFLARTKTLSWQSVAGLFALGLPWAMLVGAISRVLVHAAGLHDGDLGARTAIGALTEESLNLLPLLAFAAIFPGRVKRFSVTDWLLVGITTGLAFQAVQELSRRDGPHAGYGLSPISGGLSANGAGFAGQHILTALTAVVIGLAVAAWRHAGNPTLGAVARTIWRVLAVIGPLGCWWLTISVHAGYNATQTAGSRWLTATGPSVPWPLRWGWRLGDHGFGLGWLLLLLLLIGLLVDAGRLRNAAEEAEDPLPFPFEPTRAADEWAGRLTRWAGTRSGLPITAAVWLIAAGCAVVAYAFRDLVVVLVAHAIEPSAPAEPSQSAAPSPLATPLRSGDPSRSGESSPPVESRWRAISRGRAAGVMVRSIRAEAIGLVCRTDDPTGRRSSRFVALGGLVAVLVAALWLGPHWAAGIGDSVSAGGPALTPPVQLSTALPADAGALPWMAGVQAALGPWWSGLAIWDYAVLVLGFLALMLVSAGPLDLPWPGRGEQVLLTARSARLGGSWPGVAAGLRSYLAVTTPAEAGVDAVGALLGLVPQDLAGPDTGPDVRLAVTEYVADPVAFSATRRAGARQARQRPVAPAGGPAPRLRTGAELPPIKLADGRLLSALTPDDERLFTAGLDDLIRGDLGDRDQATAYQVRIYGDDERLISQHPEKWSDGQNSAYGLVGDSAFYDGRGPSWYAPQTLPESIRHKAYLELDRRLIEYATVVYYPANQFRGLEITTNNPLVAQALEERMTRLAIPGYVVLEP